MQQTDSTSAYEDGDRSQVSMMILSIHHIISPSTAGCAVLRCTVLPCVVLFCSVQATTASPSATLLRRASSMLPCSLRMAPWRQHQPWAVLISSWTWSQQVGFWALCRAGFGLHAGRVLGCLQDGHGALRTSEQMASCATHCIRNPTG